MFKELHANGKRSVKVHAHFAEAMEMLDVIADFADKRSEIKILFSCCGSVF